MVWVQVCAACASHVLLVGLVVSLYTAVKRGGCFCIATEGMAEGSPFEKVHTGVGETGSVPALQPALALALESGDAEGVIAEIASNPRAACAFRDHNGWTALAKAAWCGSLPCVQALLDAGADPAVTCRGSSPAELAEAAGHPEIAAALWERMKLKGKEAADSTDAGLSLSGVSAEELVAQLEAGSAAGLEQLKKRSGPAETSPLWRQQCGRKLIGVACVEHGASVSVCEHLQGAGAFPPSAEASAWADLLGAAAKQSDPDVLSMLLSSAPQKALMSPGTLGDTALHCAVRAGQVACAEVLLQSGAPWHVHGRGLEGVLSIAARQGDLPMLRLLLGAEASAAACVPSGAEARWSPGEVAAAAAVALKAGHQAAAQALLYGEV